MLRHRNISVISKSYDLIQICKRQLLYHQLFQVCRFCRAIGAYAIFKDANTPFGRKFIAHINARARARVRGRQGPPGGTYVICIQKYTD